MASYSLMKPSARMGADGKDLPMDRLDVLVQPATLSDLPGLGRDI